nr:hypothetical protein CFP56_04773 [Quercus suber]
MPLPYPARRRHRRRSRSRQCEASPIQIATLHIVADPDRDTSHRRRSRSRRFTSSPASLQLAPNRDPSACDRDDSVAGDASARSQSRRFGRRRRFSSLPIATLQFRSGRFSSDATLQLSIAGDASSFATSSDASGDASVSDASRLQKEEALQVRVNKASEFVCVRLKDQQSREPSQRHVSKRAKKLRVKIDADIVLAHVKFFRLLVCPVIGMT